MTYSLRLALAFLFALPFVAHAQLDLPGVPEVKPVTASLISEQSTIAPGKSFRVVVALQHSEHHHTYGKVLNPPDSGIPTTVKWTLPDGWKVEELPWPATQMVDSTDNKKAAGYSGIIHLPFLLTPPANLPASGTANLEALVKGLVCDQSTCEQFKLTAVLTVKIASTAVIDTSSSAIFKATESNKSSPESLGLMLVFAFLGGLILNVMPCVFPVLGIKITSVVQQAGGDRKTILFHGLAYTLGVLVSFWLLVAVLQTLRGSGQQLSWGFQLQEPLFVYAVVLVLTVFGLNMAGLFEVGTSLVGIGSSRTREISLPRAGGSAHTGADAEKPSHSELGGSFFSGLIATVVATPCAAPFLAPALTYGLALTLFPSLLFFTVIGLGLASPYLVLSASPPLLRMLPRPGAWMESFKVSMSFLMLGAAAYFVWVLMGLISETGQRDLLLGLVIVALACWIYGRWYLPHKPTSTRIKGILFTAAFLALGVWWSWPQPDNNLFKPWSPELVRALRAENKPVYIDYTARWCATCQVNKRVYKDKGLREDFINRGVVMLKADWTRPDPRIDQALAELKESAVPVNVLYIPGREAPVRLPQNLTAGNVAEALTQLDKP